jgi:hypothetical protein
MNMNSDELQNIWNSPRNKLLSEEQRKLAEQFTRQMVRRRRFQTLWLIHTFFWLAVITVLAIRAVAIGKVSPEQEWGLLPLLIVPWFFAFHFLRRYLKPVAPMTRGEISIVDSLRAALASNQEARSRLKLVGVLYVIMIPLLLLAIRQLHAVGKVSGHELTSMAMGFGAVFLIGAVGIAVKYFARLQPQQRRLDALLTELGDGPQ